MKTRYPLLAMLIAFSSSTLASNLDLGSASVSISGQQSLHLEGVEFEDGIYWGNFTWNGMNAFNVVDYGYQNSPPSDPPPENCDDECQVQRLMGTWLFSYQIISTFDSTYHLHSIYESTTDPGEYYIFGEDEYGNPDVVAGYSDSLAAFTLLDQGTIIHKYFVFNLDSASSASGCYYQVDPATSEMSRCYDMTGYRLSSVTGAAWSTANRAAFSSESEADEQAEREHLALDSIQQTVRGVSLKPASEAQRQAYRQLLDALDAN